MEAPGDRAERRWSERRIAAAVSAGVLVVSVVGLFVTVSDLLRNFHDDQAERLFLRTFWWLTALVFAAVTLTVWRSPRTPASGSVTARWLATLVCAGATLWGALILLQPLDLGSYEAICQPLAFETIGQSNPGGRCTDLGRFVGGLVPTAGGIIGAALTWPHAARNRAVSDGERRRHATSDTRINASR